MKILKHWVIISNSRNSIWKQPYDSIDAAKREFNEQITRVGYSNKGDWHIEERSTFAEDEKSTVTDSDLDF